MGDQLTTAWILFDTKAQDARNVNGHYFYADREPLDEYRNSGSEWLHPEWLEVVQVTVSKEFKPYVPVVFEKLQAEDPYTSDLDL